MSFLDDIAGDDDIDSPVSQLLIIVCQASLVNFSEIFQEIEIANREGGRADFALLEAMDTLALSNEESYKELTVNVESFLHWYSNLQQSLGDGPLGRFLSLLLKVIFFPILVPILLFALLRTWRISRRRPFEGGLLMRSSIACEAELMTCEYEAFLVESIPALLQESFIAAGTAALD